MHEKQNTNLAILESGQFIFSVSKGLFCSQSMSQWMAYSLESALVDLHKNQQKLQNKLPANLWG